MAEYQITYWRDIPAMVTAREGRRNKAKIELPQRFQVAIDEAAMRAGLIGDDAYMEQWQRNGWQGKEGTPQEVADSVGAAIEEEYDSAKIRLLMDNLGFQEQSA